MISIIIPTLNEADGIERLMRELVALDLQRRFGHELEIIIVDDGSIDGTRAIVGRVAFGAGAFSGAGARTKLIERNERGLATAVLRGFDEASGEILGVMDADFSHPVSVVPKLVQEIMNGADTAVGSRYVKGGGAEEWPFLRRMYSRLATYLARPISGGVKDPLSGFFFLRRGALFDAHGNKIAFKPRGYKILLEILVKGNWRTFKEVPFIFINRSAGKSKMNLKVTLQYFGHLLRLYVWHLTKSAKRGII